MRVRQPCGAHLTRWRLFIPDPIAVQQIACNSLMGMGFATVSRAAAHFHLQVTQPIGSRPSAPRTIPKAETEDGTAELPTFGIQQSALKAEPDRLQPWEPAAGLVLPRRADNCSLTSRQQRPVKTGDGLEIRARYKGHRTRRFGFTWRMGPSSRSGIQS